MMTDSVYRKKVVVQADLYIIPLITDSTENIRFNIALFGHMNVIG